MTKVIVLMDLISEDLNQTLIWMTAFKPSKKEEISNAITHGVGAVLAIAGLVILIVLAASKGNSWDVVGFSIFGSMMVLLYLVSTLYHSFTNAKVKALFQRFDHMAIFLFIAGTYTPFCFTVLEGPIRWIVFGVIWGCALLGVIMKIFFTGKKEFLSTILYIIMGWLAIMVIKPLYSALPLSGFVFLILGGVSYTLGTIFYMKDKIRYFHAIWHLFVLAGSTFHFFSVISLLT